MNKKTRLSALAEDPDFSPPDGVAPGHLRRFMHESLADLPRASTVLAIGCEEAFLAPQLADYSADVTVLDTSGTQIAQLARRFPEISFLRHNPANPLPFAHGTFDAIWCCEYLDRVFDPARALHEMYRVLKPGGRLLVTVPDHGRVRTMLIALFNWEGHFAPENPRIRHFTRQTLVKLAREVGFSDIEVARSGAVRRIAGQLVPRTLLLRAKKDLAAALVRRRVRARAEEGAAEEIAAALAARAA